MVPVEKSSSKNIVVSYQIVGRLISVNVSWSLIRSPNYNMIYIYNAKFWRTPIGRNRSHDAIVSLLSGRLSARSARFSTISAQNLASFCLRPYV